MVNGKYPPPRGGVRGGPGGGRTAIIGGGAAGFFCAIRLKELMPQMDVTIYERQSRVLRKVEISGGGRCWLHQHLPPTSPTCNGHTPEAADC